MDAYTDLSSARNNTSQNTVTDSAIDHEHGSNSITLCDDAGSGELSVPNPHRDYLADHGDVEAHVERSSIHFIKLDLEHIDIQPAEEKINQDHSCSNLQSCSDQVLPAFSEGVVPSALPVISACVATSEITIHDPTEVLAPVCSQLPPVSATVPRDGEEEAGAGGLLNCTPMPHGELSRVHEACLARLTDEEETGEDIDYFYENVPSSLPPSSSPPRLFPSSPCISSQSSTSGIESSKSDREVGGSPDRPLFNHLVPVAQDEASLESKHLYDPDVIASPSETGKYCSKLDDVPCGEGSPPFTKRVASQSDGDESLELQPRKRPKPDPHPYAPPAPMRATLASQNRQFKKLATPFRPPSKLPVARAAKGDQVQIVTNITKSARGSTPAVDHETSDRTERAPHVFASRNKTLHTPRSIAQFKSPLINKVLPADSHTVRPTPALQTLERKLQLLKRAIKVKEDNEEEVLVRLAGKWMEAGREVAYDVWDATKNTGDFEGRATLVRKSCGWESTDGRNAPWGWDTKLGDVVEDSCDLDPSIVPEDDEAEFNCTLGTMLRQLGIAPEIFGWDDDKETFSD